MKKVWTGLGLTISYCLFFTTIALAFQIPNKNQQTDFLVISGHITNDQGKAIKEAQINFYLNKQKIILEKTVITSKEGKFNANLIIPSNSLTSNQKIEIEVNKPGYKNSDRIPLTKIVKESTDQIGNSYFLAHQSLTLHRVYYTAFWLATTVLIIVYILIALELMHRTLAAMLGGALLLTISYTIGTFFPNWFILSFEDAINAIDMNVIFLLMAMMIIVGVTKKSGIFQWLAYKSFEIAKGNVLILSTILMLITAVCSAFLDNVTTMLLIIPVTLEIANTLKINPITLMLPEVFASNVGGTATLIGDPPNIMIGSYAKLAFIDFVENLFIICLICLVITIFWYLWWYKKGYAEAKIDNVKLMTASLKKEYKITDVKLLSICVIILSITIFMFIIHGTLHMDPSVSALFGAALLLVISKIDIVEMLEHEVEWATLIFFMFLFIVVAGAEEVGLIQLIADCVKDISQGSLTVAIIMILWVSAIASAFIDNIPFTATMLPIVAFLTQAIPGAQGGILWWALALGACLGGNGTMIGASANVVTAGMAERAGYHISFIDYMKAAWWPMIITILLSMGWLLFIMI